MAPLPLRKKGELRGTVNPVKTRRQGAGGEEDTQLLGWLVVPNPPK